MGGTSRAEGCRKLIEEGWHHVANDVEAVADQAVAKLRPHLRLVRAEAAHALEATGTALNSPMAHKLETAALEDAFSASKFALGPVLQLWVEAYTRADDLAALARRAGWVAPGSVAALTPNFRRTFVAGVFDKPSVHPTPVEGEVRRLDKPSKFAVPFVQDPSAPPLTDATPQFFRMDGHGRAATPLLRFVRIQLTPPPALPSSPEGPEPLEPLNPLVAQKTPPADRHQAAHFQWLPWNRAEPERPPTPVTKAVQPPPSARKPTGTSLQKPKDAATQTKELNELREKMGHCNEARALEISRTAFAAMERMLRAHLCGSGDFNMPLLHAAEALLAAANRQLQVAAGEDLSRGAYLFELDLRTSPLWQNVDWGLALEEVPAEVVELAHATYVGQVVPPAVALKALERTLGEALPAGQTASHFDAQLMSRVRVRAGGSAPSHETLVDMLDMVLSRQKVCLP